MRPEKHWLRMKFVFKDSVEKFDIDFNKNFRNLISNEQIYLFLYLESHSFAGPCSELVKFWEYDFEGSS